MKQILVLIILTIISHTIKFINLNNISLLNSYIYTNINKARKNLYLKLILAINNIQISPIIINFFI